MASSDDLNIDENNQPTFDLAFYDTFVNAQKKDATVKATKAHVKLLKEFLCSKGERKEIHIIDAKTLNLYLCEFFVKLKKKDGKEYEPSSVENIKASIERHLKEKYYPHVITSDIQFQRTRDIIKAKKMSLKKQGLGRKANASARLEPTDESRLFSSHQLGSTTPRSLQFSIFYNFSKGFGLRGRDEHRHLCFGDIVVKSTSTGVEYLEMRERASKTMDGSKKDDFRPTTPKIFSTDGGDSDPVVLFKLFCKKRPIESMEADHAFYLTPIPEKRIHPTAECWYYKTPMGVNSLGDLLKNACKSAGINGKKTNHSLRKTTVAELSTAGVAATKIIQVTGHKNVQSLQHYDTELGLEEHQNISSLVCTKKQTTTTTTTEQSQTLTLSQENVEETNIAVPSSKRKHSDVESDDDNDHNPMSVEETQNTSKGIFKGATFNNCTFSFTFKK